MDRPRLCLLNASYDPGNTRRNFRRELAADLVEFHTPAGELPAPAAVEAFDEFDGCVVTGSRASVYWDDAWIDDVRAWVSDAIATGMPFLGVCWGHQLLADAMGGEVRAMGEYEIGYRSVSRVGDSRLFDGINPEFTAFQTHSDCVASLPGDAELIAENGYGVQGFRAGDVFGVQFHPEYDTSTAAEVTRGKESLSEERIRDVLGGITDDTYAEACRTKQLFDNFLGVVRERRAAAVGARAASD